MLVVVIDVVDRWAFELAAVPDDGAVEEFAADRSGPLLSEGVGRRGPGGRLRCAGMRRVPAAGVRGASRGV